MRFHLHLIMPLIACVGLYACDSKKHTETDDESVDVKYRKPSLGSVSVVTEEGKQSSGAASEITENTTANQLSRILVRRDSYGFTSTEKVQIKQNVEQFSKENGLTLLEACESLIPQSATARDRYAAVVRLLSCFPENYDLRFELALSRTAQIKPMAVLNALNSDLVKSQKFEALEKYFNKLPQGQVRRSWANQIVRIKAKREGISEALNWIEESKSNEDQKASLSGFLSYLRSKKGVSLSDDQKAMLIETAKKNKMRSFEMLLNAQLDKQFDNQNPN